MDKEQVTEADASELSPQAKAWKKHVDDKHFYSVITPIVAEECFKAGFVAGTKDRHNDVQRLCDGYDQAKKDERLRVVEAIKKELKKKGKGMSSDGKILFHQFGRWLLIEDVEEIVDRVGGNKQ